MGDWRSRQELLLLRQTKDQARRSSLDEVSSVGPTFMDSGVVAMQMGYFHSHVMSAGLTLSRDMIRHKLTAQALQIAVSTFSVAISV